MTAREKFEKWWYETRHGCISDQDVAWLVWQAALSAAPTPPEVEPVAWFDEADLKHVRLSGFANNVLTSTNKGGCCNIPLFTRPPAPNDELRAAACNLVRAMRTYPMSYPLDELNQLEQSLEMVVPACGRNGR